MHLQGRGGGGGREQRNSGILPDTPQRPSHDLSLPVLRWESRKLTNVLSYTRGTRGHPPTCPPPRRRGRGRVVRALAAPGEAWALAAPQATEAADRTRVALMTQDTLLSEPCPGDLSGAVGEQNPLGIKLGWGGCRGRRWDSRHVPSCRRWWPLLSVAKGVSPSGMWS